MFGAYTTSQEAPLNRIRSLISLGIILFVAQLTCAQTAPSKTGAHPQLSGYTAQSSDSERDWEKKFQDGIVSDNVRENNRRMSARPHHVGSPYDKDNAEWILSKFKEWGFDAHIETFQVLFPTPKERVVELVQPTQFRAKLQEPAVPGDPTSNQNSEQLPTYNAYSGDGDVTAPLVYVNYGCPKTTTFSTAYGIDVKGNIVIVRYGEASAAPSQGCAGARRSRLHHLFRSARRRLLSRGRLSQRPLSPIAGRPARQRARPASLPRRSAVSRLGLRTRIEAPPDREAQTIMKIPVLPISYADAQPLLANLTGPVAPEPWRGALPITYHLGPGSPSVHMNVVMDNATRPLYDVIARIPGSDFPDQWVLDGNHHDAWVHGAERSALRRGVSHGRPRARLGE